MRQLLYISSATAPMGEQDVRAILATSRLRNGVAGITGLLLYDGRRFLQALEGAGDAVERTFDRIKADKRHRAVVLLSSAEVETRAFGDWAMAADRVQPGESSGIGETVDRLTSHVVDPNVRALFRSFARIREAA